jgi:TolB-like protein
MRKLAAIMFTDIVGYTALMGEDEQKALQLLEKNRTLLKPIVEQFRGEWLKEIGDGTLSCFHSAVDAVNCALAIQQVLKDDPDLKLRIGIHIGDVVFEEGDVFGDGVNVASRIEPLAEPGGICISEKVHDDIRNKSGVATVFVGERTLKGVDKPVKVYTVSAGCVPPQKLGPSALAVVSRNRWMGGVLVAAAAVVVGLVLYMAGMLGVNGAEFTPQLGERSVAVLPFTNLSDSKTDEYFSDGVTEDILTHLSKIGDLRVIARTSVMQYKDTRKRIRDIAAELGVATILEGSVRRSESQVRITGQLIDARTEEHLWAETYDRTLDDIFVIQSDVAQKIASALEATLTSDEIQRIDRTPTESTEAYQLYLQGRYFWNKRTDEDILKAKEYFEQAIEVDPLYAQAYVGLADSYNLLHQYTNLPSNETYPKGRAAAMKALEIDPGAGEAHISLAYGLFEYYWEYAAAEREYRWGLELSPNYATGRQWHGEYLACVSRLEEALAELLKARELDPLSFVILSVSSWVHHGLRNLEMADDINERVMEMAPDWPTTYYKALLSMDHQGRYDDAAQYMEQFVRLKGASLDEIALLLDSYKRNGIRGLWRAYLHMIESWEEMTAISPFDFAVAYAHLGDTDQAFRWLERCYQERRFQLNVIRTYGYLYVPGLDSDPRFQDLLHRMNFPE